MPVARRDRLIVVLVSRLRLFPALVKLFGLRWKNENPVLQQKTLGVVRK